MSQPSTGQASLTASTFDICYFDGFRADRLSCHRFLANAFRLLLYGFAYNLVNLFRLHLPQPWRSAQIETLCARLFKLGARVRQTARCIRIHLATGWPFQSLFCDVALEAVIPPTDEFPYTIRIVSETLESNGSSSMGSVCGSTLALMDAGVPIKAPVSGIAMGLVKEGDDYVILTDIQGAEDHLGDMDFKVAGTREGITGLQMDIKITGVTREIMQAALEQAKRAREIILDKMLEAIPEVRTELNENAPRISTVKIDPEKIGMVIGKGGETIRGLEADHEVQIDIEEDGTILIYATDGQKAASAIAAVEALTKEPEVGDEFLNAKVVKTTQFGAFVELKKGTDGLLHVSNVGPGRVGHIEDVINRGDILDVLVQEVDKARGRIGLKLIQKHENGNTVSPEELIERAKDAPPREPSEDRPRDGDRRGGRGGRSGGGGGRGRDRERS